MMENSIHMKRCSRLSCWFKIFSFTASCFIILSFFTSHVNCVETKANLNLTTCVLSVNFNIYNLSSLVRHDGDQPWELSTIMSRTFPSYQQVFINLCRPLPKSTPNFVNGGCGESSNSSICLIDTKKNSTTSLADFNNIEATFDHDDYDAIHLKMRSANHTVNLFFHCNPSLKNNLPILIDQKDNNLTIEWFDAAGCPKEKVIGDDCQVYVPSIGKVFDLTPLKKDGGYNFPENGYNYFINVCDRINKTECGLDSGICHYSKDGKMHYSLGKWSDKISYSDGVLTLLYTDGDPYRNAERTPRVTKILFICNTTVGLGKPDFVEETDRTYIIHWETKYACPKPTRSVNCIWQNSTHRIDLSPFKKTSGNFMVPLSNSFVVINACSPINPKVLGIQRCPLSSGVCYVPTIDDGGNTPKTLNLGQPNEPPQLLFDDQINLVYSDGDICPYSDPGTRYSTRITFSCDRNAGEGEPNLIEGSQKSCAWLFEWKTSLVCEARPIYAHQCIFEDNMNGLKVDLTQVFSSVPLISEQNNSTVKTFFINICSHDSPAKGYQDMVLSKKCVNSSVCFSERTLSDNSAPLYISLGDLSNSEYFFQGESLILKFSGGSSCGHNKNFSSEIDIKCSTSPKTNYLGRDISECFHKFLLESPLVCGLKSPTCTYRVNDSLVDLRQLSSISHAWKVVDSQNGKIYYINLCNNIPTNHPAGDGISSVVECDFIEGEENCGKPIGRKDNMTMSMEYNADESKKALTITYTNDDANVCAYVPSAITRIKLVCNKNHRSEPSFIQKIDNQTNCEYHFEWETFLACFSNDHERQERPMKRIENYFIDNRPELGIDTAINMSEIFNNVHVVSDGKYEYTLDLAGNELDRKGNCVNAAICQREVNKTFTRDIGSLKTEMMVIQGNKIKLKLTATNHQKCGKNNLKNVTSTVFFQCSSSESGIGSPTFFYESNDCDYIFLWETDIVCPAKMQPAADLVAQLQNQSVAKSQGFSTTASLFNVIIIALCIILFAIVPWIVFRLSYREKRNYLVHWIRSKFRSPVITSFTYSQVSSDSTKLVSMNDDL